MSVLSEITARMFAIEVQNDIYNKDTNFGSNPIRLKLEYAI